jgi:hypothetical protein
VRSFFVVVGAATILLLSACDGPQRSISGPEDDSGLDLSVSQARYANTPNLQQEADRIDAEMLAFMRGVNARLAADGESYRVAVAEWVGMGMEGRTVEFRDRGNKQLPFHFVPGDPRRSWSGPPGASGDDITWAVDQTGDAVPIFGGLSASDTDAAISRAMGTWDGQACSTLPLRRKPDFGLDIGVIAWMNGLGGSPFIVADVQHAGFKDIDFFGDVLGVTYTFQFIDGSGQPTDIDGNGKIDVAFREIYYDPSWLWALDGSFPNVDLETVAVHETGHGLSQEHFGELFVTAKNAKGHLAPRALMNARYTGVHRGLSGSDRGGHCSIWASWPNN